MLDLHIRPARSTDLAALTGELGQGPYFVDRLSRQQAGRGLLLTAWRDDHPIGDVYLWLEPAEEPEIREHLPDTPLLTHLEIHADHRNQGTGTKLMLAAEQELVALGHEQVALGVEVTNVAAAMLYLRLGYREWPHPPVRCYALADGKGTRRIEICRIMVKRLAG
jgi:GNAT superfamily N-acetyltransferase